MDVVRALGSTATLPAHVAASGPDAVLVEWRPRGDNADTLLAIAVLSVRCLTPAPPVIALCAETDGASAAEAGADYCVAVGGEPAALLRVLDAAVASPRV